MMFRPTARMAHKMRLAQTKISKKQARPLGNYLHAEHEYGTVAAIHAGPPPTVDLYLNGSQNMGSTTYLTTGVKYLAPYVPTVGDVVLIQRGSEKLRTSRMILGKPNGSASPTIVPFCAKNGSGQWTIGPNGLWGGSGAPPASLGTNGDFYFRTDTGNILFKSAGAWTVKV
jgi:hypothetical protein